jgi:hypothetical protein
MVSLKFFRNTCGPDKNSILAMLGVGILIGLFICGIPLAIMTTLYLEESKFNDRYIVLFIQFHIESQTTSSTVSPSSSVISSSSLSPGSNGSKYLLFS